MRIPALRWLVVPAALGLGLVAGAPFVASSASAAGIHAYGPVPPCVCTATPTTLSPGQTLTLNCSGFGASETVSITIHSQDVSAGSVVASPSGAFSTGVTIPTDLAYGAHEVIATGDTTGRIAAVAITLVAPAVVSVPVTTPLAITGADEAGLAGVGAAAIAVGGGLVLASRKRRKNHFA